MSAYNPVAKRKYYELNKEKITTWSADDYLKKRDAKLRSARGQHLKTKYFKDCTPLQALKKYEEMMSAQKGVCAICGKPETKVDPQYGKVCNLAVDHNPKNGKVRGLLCFLCNTTLGRFERNLRSILTYLANGIFKK